MATLLELYETIGGTMFPTSATVTMGNAPVGPIVTDSRQVEPGRIFWALPGAIHNGSEFAADAFARGAAGMVVDRPVDPSVGAWAVCVNDTQRALWQWARFKRRKFTGTMIAVTGSVGKTTTRQMIHTVLASRLTGTASPRNFNNHIGLPLSMLQIEPHHDYAVLELGANHRGEIASLARLCCPKVGIITRVADAHLGEFGSRQAIARAKAELLAALPEDGRAVLGDDPLLRSVARRSRAEITWVGTGPDCHLRATDLQIGRGWIEFKVNDCPFRVPVWGLHHVTAALAAVAVGRMLGFDMPQIADSLARFESLPMRCEVLEVRGATIINDAYNASPAAMRAALELLRDFDALGRRIVVCGDMAELGDEAASLHWQLGHQAYTVSNADLLIACGQFARHVVSGARAAGMISTRAIPCATVDDAMPFLGQAIMPGDAVLVKGSRVMAMERIVKALEQYPRRRSA
jgi:UDP-N-acetylmuramoyl-tripeptide--D-alanyl-D-alanine ligase